MNSKGSANLSVRIGMDTDKENVDPLQDLTANVRGAAITAMAAHVDGLAKSSKKRSRGAKSSNSEKIEILYQLVDNVKCLFLLVYDVSQYLLSTSKNSLTDRQQSLQTQKHIQISMCHCFSHLRAKPHVGPSHTARHALRSAFEWCTLEILRMIIELVSDV